MTKYASTVPHTYESIMDAATRLSSVMKGGVDQVTEWMPLVGDIAAATGLSVQEAADQIARMYSAGAGAADLFREKGVLAMMGFQSGATYSVEETRKKIMSSWKSTTSMFRGAAMEMADTWDGLMSMISDKWFQSRKAIMDAGLFNYIKAIASVINDKFGEALTNNKDKAKEWSDSIINGIESVLKVMGVFVDGWHGIKIIFKGAQIAWEGFKGAMELGFSLLKRSFETFLLDWNYYIAGPIEKAAAFFGKKWDLTVDFHVTGLPDLQNSADEIEKLKGELQQMLMEPLPSVGWQKAIDDIRAKFEDLQAAAKKARDSASGGGGNGGEAKDATKALKDFRDAIGDVYTEQEKLNQRIAQIWKDYDKAIAGGVDATYAWELATKAEMKAWDDMGDKSKETSDVMTEFMVQAARNMQNAMGDYFFNIMQGNFDNLGQRFKAMIDRMVADLLASQLLEMIANMMKTSSNATIANIGGQLLQHKAIGGPVYQGVPVMTGEYGPELFVPKENGTIVTAANTQGNGMGGIHVKNQFFIQADNGRVSMDSQRQVAAKAALSVSAAARRNR